MAERDWFEELWNRPRTFKIQQPSEAPTPCEYAAEFQNWCDELGTLLLGEANNVAVNQCKLLLQDRYHAWRESVPKRHQDYVGGAHICLWHVYLATYKKLRMAELAISAPPLFVPENPKRRKALERLTHPALNGVVIGEVIDGL